MLICALACIPARADSVGVTASERGSTVAWLWACFLPALREIMKTHSELFEVATRGKGTYEITDRVAGAVTNSAVSTGTATVFVQHTSASLIVFENADRSARVDLQAFFERLVPEDSEYFNHTSEGPDDSTSHIKMVLTRSSEVIPIADGRLQLGAWQGIYLFEHRRSPHRRRIAVSVIGE